MFSDDFKDALPIEKDELKVCLFGLEDISERYIGWLNNKELVRFSNQRFMTHDEASCRDFFNSVNQSNSVFLAVKNTVYGHIGTMTVHFNQRHGTADMGILIGETSVPGAGSTAWHLVLDKVLSLSGVRKVTAGTLSCNKAMLGVIRKSDMVPDGIRVQHELVEGVAFDMLHFARFSYD